MTPRSAFTDEQLPDEYCRHLAKAALAFGADGSNPTLWTQAATAALVRVGCAAFPKGSHAAKGHPDEYGRSEYKAHDVKVWDPAGWGPPLFIAEHDNSGNRERVQYDAWKLLTTEATTRVLVAYFGVGTNMRSFGELTKVVERVAQDNPGKSLLLIGGEYSGTSVDPKLLRASHAHAAIRR